MMCVKYCRLEDLLSERVVEVGEKTSFAQHGDELRLR
jgi:hypothetical protein